MTIQDKECRPHQLNCHLLALTAIETKTKRQLLPFTAWWATAFPSKQPAPWLLPPFGRQTGRHSELPREESGMLRATQYSSPAPDSPECDATNPQWATTFTSHLGTPALEPMPEDCRECRRFLAVASGWASANCWMAACRALRDAASLEGRMERRGIRGHGAKARRLRPSAGLLRKIGLHCIPGHHR